MTKYLVETISQFRNRYIIDSANEEDAVDMVNKESSIEFSNRFLSEVISSSREITEEEYLTLFDKDNELLQYLDVKEKLKFVNKADSEWEFS